MFIRSIQSKNYRTLEDIRIEFHTHYTAICGRNNCGKSNLLNIVRHIFTDPRQSRAWRSALPVEISHATDYTAWRLSSAPNDPIEIRVSVELDSDRDQSLLEVIRRLSSVVAPQISHDARETSPSSRTEVSALEISIELQATERQVHIQHGPVTLDDVAASETLKKLRSSGALLYHNSTNSHHMLFGGTILRGVLSKLSADDRDRLTDKQRALSQQVTKIVEKHRQEIADLLGRLNEKYDVKLSAHEIQLEDDWPVELLLGERDFSVPLQDWGAGTRNQTWILRTLFDAVRISQATSPSERLMPMVVIEEPESFLHPLAQAKFGNVLQDLADELKIQVITTTHSPYLLSHRDPRSNILLTRKEDGRARLPRGTHAISTTNSEDWKAPFEHALGITGDEFNLFKEALFSRSSEILLVEGPIDQEYFKLLQDARHGKQRLQFSGDIFAYGGWSNIRNTVLMKFIRDRFQRVVVTCDLDAESQVSGALESLGFKKGVDFFPIGVSSTGKKCIEGLLPDRIKAKVRAENPDLLDALSSGEDKERKAAKEKLKKLYLDEFQKTAVPGEDYTNFYKLAKKVQGAFRSRSS